MISKRFVAIPAAGLLLASLAWAADAPGSEGFTSLFNGRDLAGWKVPDGDNGHWKVVEGVIDYDARSEARGDKNLWTEREYGDFVLQLDWRLKEAPFLNKNVPYILPDGTHAKDVHGKEMKLPLPDADSGVFLRGHGDYQVNIWCWPIGSSEMYTPRTSRETPPDRRAAVTPRHRADKPVGEWNRFEITVIGKTVKVVLNGTTVIPGATIPDLPEKGRLALQHHGSKNERGEWTGPPSLVQFRNIRIKELPPGPARSRPAPGAVRALLITGGHDHEAAFYSLFDDIDRLPVDTAANAFRSDMRGKYDVLIMYDFTRDLDESARKNLRDFVEAGGGVVVLHHALLNYRTWTWWSEEVVGGRYRLRREGGDPPSRVTNDQQISVTTAAAHPVLDGIAPFRIQDETYKNMYISSKIRPLLTTDNPASDVDLAWVGPCATARVVAIQLGHGRSAFGHPSYRALVHNAVRWAAGKAE
jgi:type 1 glutamine amidotransferase